MSRRIGAFAILALGACTQNMSASQVPPQPRYVAMGSSYAAGPMLGRPKPATPARCGRDFGNYATLLSQRLNLDLLDATCSGATTAHILAPWYELPAQIEAVTPETALVTVTIGGNDVNFVGNLFALTCDPATSQRPCQPSRLPTEADWAALETNMRAIAAQVRSHAPKARLVFVDYVTIVPEKTCPAVPLAVSDAVAIRATASRLARLTAQVARESAAELIRASDLSKRHTPCDAEPWAVGAPGIGTGAPWHPNADGMDAVAEALTRLIHAP